MWSAPHASSRADEEATLAILTSLRVELIQPTIADHGGRVFKLMGDGLLAECPSVVDAVRAAIATQRALALRHAEGGLRLAFRIGVHLGDVVVDGDDLQGDGVNLAARLEGLAEPGGIHISAAVHEQIRDRNGMIFEDLGERQVKNIERPVRVWRWTGAAATVDAPGAAPFVAEKPSLRRAAIERATRKRPDNLDAYDLYLRALEQSYRFTPAGRAAGLALLDATLVLAPDYAEAHGVAAFCLQQRFLWGGRDPADRASALVHAEAVAGARTDDATALALAALALSALDGRHDAAVLMVDRALSQTPSSAIAHSVGGLVNMMLANPEAAERHAERSLRLSPFDPLRHIPETTLGVVKLVAGATEAALPHVRRGLEANPGFAPGLTTLAICQVRLGRLDDARATIQRLLDIAPDTRIATLGERFLFVNALGFEPIAAYLRVAGLPE